MITKLLTICAFIGLWHNSYSQSSDTRLAIGLYTGVSDYRGDLNQEWFNRAAYRTQLGATIMYYVNPFLNAGIDVGYGQHGFQVNFTNGYRADVLKANLQTRLKFNNGKWLAENNKFQPYIFAGVGIANTFEDAEAPSSNVPGNDFTGNAGLGFNYMFKEFIGFNYNLNYALTGRDLRDNVSNGFNDQFMIHSVGLVIPVGEIVDTDRDGISDKRDKCPNTPAGITVDPFGCPDDSDGDGVADYQDACPMEKGLPSMKGCPDRDNDGIADAVDNCPDVKGDASANGCPDSDGDGIPDDEDECPRFKGTREMNGCPDRDFDGIKDSEDTCPDDKGSLEMRGCPDTDGDGIADNLDQCPKVAGIAPTGCPEIKVETQKILDRALTGVQFETGKAIIKKTSFSILDNVATIMEENPSYQLDIKGHTDAQGDDEKNLILSKDRALSVKNYLVQKGISIDRMESYGLGETEPKATNETPAGRAENRRVEFKIRF